MPLQERLGPRWWCMWQAHAQLSNMMLASRRNGLQRRRAQEPQPWIWVVELITPPGVVELSLGQGHITHSDWSFWSHRSRRAAGARKPNRTVSKEACLSTATKVKNEKCTFILTDVKGVWMCMASIALPHFCLSLQFEHFSKEPASNLPKHFNTSKCCCTTLQCCLATIPWLRLSILWVQGNVLYMEGCCPSIKSSSEQYEDFF